MVEMTLFKVTRAPTSAHCISRKALRTAFDSKGDYFHLQHQADTVIVLKKMLPKRQPEVKAALAGIISMLKG